MNEESEKFLRRMQFYSGKDYNKLIIAYNAVFELVSSGTSEEEFLDFVRDIPLYIFIESKLDKKWVIKLAYLVKL